MKFRQLLFLGLFFVTGTINAQTDFRSGYVIKLNNDTVKGEIDYRGDILMGRICRFKINDKEKEIIYSPNELLAFRFTDSKYFISREVDRKNVFLEFLIKGQINLYYLRDDNGDRYFIDKKDMGMVELPYEEGIRYKNDIAYQYTSTKHIGILNVYLNDAPEFQARIAQMGRPEQKTLVKLAEDYHNKVCKDESCIIFEKKMPWLQVNLEIAGGAVNFQNLGYRDKYYFQGGILAHLWMPTSNEKLFFRIGVLYTKLELDNAKETVYKVPLQIEYVYPKGLIRPKAAYGINIYKPFCQAASFMGGFNIKLTKFSNLSIDYDIDFIPSYDFPLIPDGILSQSLSTGLIIKL